MKKISKGFTLAEILICVAIVGIIAALVAPGLVNQMSKVSAGATLARAVEQIEAGCRQIIEVANSNYEGDEGTADTLGAIRVGDIPHADIENVSDDDPMALYFDRVGYPYMDMEPLDYTAAERFALRDSLKPYDNTSNASIVIDKARLTLVTSRAYKFKKIPANVWIFSSNSTNDNNLDDDEYLAAWVYIDVNGFQKDPNTFGRDIFVFRLNNKGILIPEGKTTYKDTCADDNITDGKSCTARVVMDGWKITYY